ADSSAWTKTGNSPYSGVYKWKYEEIANQAFNNHQKLLFGFRWINGSGSSTDTASSFAIDDIKLVGTYDFALYPVKLSIGSTMYNVPVCPGGSMTFVLNISAPLCGTGSYLVQVSGPGGSFSNPIATLNYVLNNDYS